MGDGQKTTYDLARLQFEYGASRLANIETTRESFYVCVCSLIELHERGEVESSAILKMILEEFDMVESSVSGAWRAFDKKYKSVRRKH